MKYQKLLALFATAFAVSGLASHESFAGADEALAKSQTTADTLDSRPVHPYDFILTLEAGPYKPKSISFTNWNNNSFTYDDSTLNAFSAQLGWGMNLYKNDDIAIIFNESLDYSNFTYKLPADLAANPGNVSVSMHMFSFDSRLQVAWNNSPVLSLIPFAEGGYMVTLWNQNGPTDLTAGEGTAGNLVAGAGLRFWLNRAASLNHEFPSRYSALPIFITAKVNQVFSNNAGVDPGATSVLGGLSVGL